jgi:hypothetical protein
MLPHILHQRSEAAVSPLPFLRYRAQAHLAKTMIQRKRERQPPIAREVPRCIRAIIEKHRDLKCIERQHFACTEHRGMRPTVLADRGDTDGLTQLPFEIVAV